MSFSRGTVSQNDLMYFKNEILGNIKVLEYRLSELLDKTSLEIEVKFHPYETKFHEINNKINDLTNLVSKNKSNSEKIEQLLKFKKSTEDTLISHVNMIGQCSKDISNACFKYDKLLLNNFVIPGLIGNNCKYQSFKAYIEHSLSQISNLNSFKDNHTVDLKSYKEKLENIIKQFSSQIEAVKSSFIDYCKKLFEESDAKNKEALKLIDEKIEQIKLENSKYSIELKQKCDEIGLDWLKILRLKEEVFERFDTEKENFIKYSRDLNNTFEEHKKEFKLIKKKFTELSEFIKDIRFRKNIMDLKKDTKEMAKKINFDKKQKYIDSDEEQTSYQLQSQGEEFSPYLSLHRKGQSDNKLPSINNSRPARRKSRLSVSGTVIFSRKPLLRDESRDYQQNTILTNPSNEDSNNSMVIKQERELHLETSTKDNNLPSYKEPEPQRKQRKRISKTLNNMQEQEDKKILNEDSKKEQTNRKQEKDKKIILISPIKKANRNKNSSVKNYLDKDLKMVESTPAKNNTNNQLHLTNTNFIRNKKRGSQILSYKTLEKISQQGAISPPQNENVLINKRINSHNLHRFKFKQNSEDSNSSVQLNQTSNIFQNKKRNSISFGLESSNSMPKISQSNVNNISLIGNNQNKNDLT